MTEPKGDLEDQKIEITEQIKALSGLLGIVPSDPTTNVHEPMTNDSMTLENWLSATRDSFLKLSLLISRTLDIPLE